MIDYTEQIKNLCIDIIKNVPELQHIDPDLIAYCIRTSRGTGGGRVASITAFMPKPNSLGDKVGLKPQRILTPEKKVAVYMLQIYMPRFYKESLAAKIDTICHELWHISPDFDGTLRDGGVHYRTYQNDINRLKKAYLHSKPDLGLLEFFKLKLDPDNVWGWMYPLPKPANLDEVLESLGLPITGIKRSPVIQGAFKKIKIKEKK